MQVILPKSVIATCFLLENAGYSAYIVGGAIRDILLGKNVVDWDFTTNAMPQEIQQVFPNHFYDNAFGTVGVAIGHLYEQLGLQADQVTTEEKGEIYEITTFRSESAYSDHRRPDEVTWGKSLEEDLQRRDFTMNAMALSFQSTPEERRTFFARFLSAPQEMNYEVDLVDPYQGQTDIRNKIIKTVGDPDIRFNEDALRMLRAVRLSAELHFQLDQNILIAMQTHAHDIQHVSWERIRDEFLRILLTDEVESAFSVLATTGILKHILPELMETRNVEQRGHHEFDVWTHTLRAVQSNPSKDPIVKFATLLHDIAKPQTQTPIPEQSGEYSFHNHEVMGARIARDIARRFRLSKNDVQRVFLLVRWHMFHYQPEMTDAAIRRFIKNVGVENIHDMMDLREGDRLGSGSKRTSWRLEEMKDRIDKQLHQPMQIKDLAIDGTEVMKVLDIPPSRKVGDILKELFEEVLEDPNKNTKEYLVERVKNYGK